MIILNFVKVLSRIHTMEFSIIILLALSVMLIEFLEYTSGMDPNLPPDVMLRDWWDGSSEVDDLFGGSHSGTTISNHTDQSQLNRLDRDLMSSKNDSKSLTNKTESEKFKESAIHKAKRQFREMEHELEDRETKIHEMRIGISQNRKGKEKIGGSGSSATSSSRGGPSTVDTLKDNLQRLNNKIQEIRNVVISGKLKGRAIISAQREMMFLEKEKIKKKKEIVEEDLRLQLGRNVETEEVERAYIEQEKNQRKLELQQRRTEIERELEQKVQQKSRRGSKVLLEELKNIDKELNE